MGVICRQVETGNKDESAVYKLSVGINGLGVWLQDARIHWKHKELVRNYISAEDNCKASNSVTLICVVEHWSNCQQHSDVDPAKADWKPHWLLGCVVWGWDENWNHIRSPEMQQMTCRRIRMEEERVSLWAALANGNRAVKSICNISVHLTGRIQYLKDGRQGEGYFVVDVWTLVDTFVNKSPCLCSSRCASRCAQQKQDEPWYLWT